VAFSKGSRKVRVLAVSQRFHKNNVGFNEVLLSLQQTEGVELDAIFAPRFSIKVGRERVPVHRQADEIGIHEQAANTVEVAFDDFYCLLAACLFEDSLLVSRDFFQDIVPNNLKRGNLGTYSVLMSTAKSKKEEAQLINELRDEWRRMLRPQFRDAILFDLIPQMTGLKLDYLRKTVAVRPQCHDGLIYLPFEETIEEGEQKFKKWAVCNLKDE